MIRAGSMKHTNPTVIRKLFNCKDAISLDQLQTKKIQKLTTNFSFLHFFSLRVESSTENHQHVVYNLTVKKAYMPTNYTINQTPLFQFKKYSSSGSGYGR